MIERHGFFLAASVVAGALAFGCSASPDEASAVPELEADGLEAQDEGTSYNGWTQSVSGNTYDINGANYAMGPVHFTFTKVSGSQTSRGGGACFIMKKYGSSCTSDTTCTTKAQQAFGSSAWGYCFQGECYHRPGAASTYCIIGPSWSAGTHTATYPILTDLDFTGYNPVPRVLGCMTKAAGPSTACGGSDPTQYMRWVAVASSL